MRKDSWISMGAVLLWLAIPLVALIVGIVWAYFISRPARPAAVQESVESFSRFRRALAEPDAGQRRPRRTGVGENRSATHSKKPPAQSSRQSSGRSR
jgi:hypothetical protein